jgi:hypothetical protein
MAVPSTMLVYGARAGLNVCPPRLKKFNWLLASILGLLVGLHSSWAGVSEIKAALLEGIRQGALDRKNLAQPLDDPGSTGDFISFETDVLNRLQLAPELRDLAQFGEKWNLSSDEVFDVMIYYGTHMWFDDPNAVTSPRLVFSRLQDIAVADFLNRYGLEYKATDDIYDPAYGYLKKSGQLVPIAVFQYMADHFRYSDERLAGQLKVSVESLREFLARHRITRLGENAQFRPTLPNGLLDKYAEQRVALQRVLDWIVANKRVPMAKNFNVSKGQVNIGYVRLTSTIDDYKNDKGIFPSAEAFWLELYRFGQSQGVEVQLLDVVFRGDISQELKVIIKRQAVRRVLDWLRAHSGRVSQLADFGTGEGRIRIGYGRLTSTIGKYKNDKGIFPSAQEFWLGLYRFGQSQGVEVQLLDVAFRGDISQELKAIIKRQAVQRVLDWIRTHSGQVPRLTNFGTGKGQIQVNYAHLTSTAEYRNNKGIFPSVEDFWLELYRLGQTQNMEVELLDVVFSGDISQELKLILKQQAVRRVLDWIIERSGQVPQIADFGTTEEGQIHFGYPRLTSSEKYKNDKGIFPSPEVFWLELYRFGQSKGVEVQLLDVVFRGDISQEVKAIIKRQAVQRVFDWIRTHRGETPRAKDFGGQGGQIQIVYSRLMSNSTYKNSGIFSTAEDFWRALYDLAQSQGLQIKLPSRLISRRGKADNACDSSLWGTPAEDN